MLFEFVSRRELHLDVSANGKLVKNAYCCYISLPVLHLLFRLELPCGYYKISFSIRGMAWPSVTFSHLFRLLIMLVFLCFCGRKKRPRRCSAENRTLLWCFFNFHTFFHTAICWVLINPGSFIALILFSYCELFMFSLIPQPSGFHIFGWVFIFVFQFASAQSNTSLKLQILVGNIHLSY